MSRLAIISGSGQLPLELAAACPDALRVTFRGMAHGFGDESSEHRFEKLGALFETLKSQGVGRVVFAGGMSRPELNPSEFDAFMVETAPRLLDAFQNGDDQLLRLIVSIFEEQGFDVVGAHTLLIGATVPVGLMGGPAPSEQNLADAHKAAEILRTLAPLDVGQGAVVSAGLCLGIETLQGTDALLSFVAQTPAHLHRTAGTFLKTPKAGQDLRVDMPAIGPDTIGHVAQAGLAGVALAAGRVLVLDREATVQKAEELGVFIYGLAEV